MASAIEKQNLRSLGIISLMVIIFWFISPPNGLTVQAWHMLILFVATIVGAILRPLPTSAIAILGLTACVGTQVLNINQALSGYSSSTVWLVVMSFLVARGFIKSGLGKRLAFIFVRVFGRSTLGLGYGLVFTDFLFAPFIPSNTARGGGVVFPILKSICVELGSNPERETEDKFGAFLLKLCFQANLVTSSLFLTSMAANPLAAGLAKEMGVDITWMSWFKFAIVPGLCHLLLLPIVCYFLFPPQIKKTPQAPQLALKKLKEMGPPRYEEIIMAITFILLLILWIAGKSFGLDATSASFIGLTLLMVSGVLTWDDIVQEKEAWNTFIWLATLLMMASFLNKFGLIAWMSELVQSHLSGLNWVTALSTLSLIYYFSHYLFASMTSHVSSMYPPFLAVAISLGAPPVLSALLLGVLSSLFGGLTHYGTGPAPVYFGAGYMSLIRWWRYGLILGLFGLFVWTIIGSIWWKGLGLI